MVLPRECLKYFADVIEATIGIVYSETNYYQLETRLEDLSRQLGLGSPLDLWEKAKSGMLTPAMKHLLVDIATNNETSFFRDANVFKAIRVIAEQSAAGHLPDHTFRVWSAACSSGQEIYSLAILFQDLKDKWPFYYSIHATDISERMLQRAQDGCYTQLEVQRGLSPAQLEKHFKTSGSPAGLPEAANTWEVQSELRRGLTFQKLNLLESWTGLGQYHLILCRNVLIYQTVENKKKVIAKIYDHLLPGGYVILGGAESLIGLFDALTYVTIDGSVVYQKPGKAQPAQMSVG